MIGAIAPPRDVSGRSNVRQRCPKPTFERDAMFTGKPRIDELGYAFLLRNYRPDNGKWQTADPLGYPDGWNNLAYCGNNTMERVDPNGLDWMDDIVSSVISSYASKIIDAAVAAAMGAVAENVDVYVNVTNLNVSGLSVTFDYTDAYTMFLVPIGSGTGTFDPSSAIQSDGNYTNTFIRTTPEKYTQFDKDYYYCQFLEMEVL